MVADVLAPQADQENGPRSGHWGPVNQLAVWRLLLRHPHIPARSNSQEVSHRSAHLAAAPPKCEDGSWAFGIAPLLLLDPDGRVVLFSGVDPAQPQRPPVWFPVGGGVDEGETLEEGAIREVRDETGRRSTSAIRFAASCRACP